MINLSQVVVSNDCLFTLALSTLIPSHLLIGTYLIVDVKTTGRRQVEQAASHNTKIFAFICSDFDYYALCHLDNVIFIDRKSTINEVLLCLSHNHSHYNYRLKVKLSKNESYVLSCLQEGLDTREIGQRLGVDIKSVYASRLRLMNKMQVGNRIELYQNIVRQGGTMK